MVKCLYSHEWPTPRNFELLLIDLLSVPEHVTWRPVGNSELEGEQGGNITVFKYS